MNTRNSKSKTVAQKASDEFSVLRHLSYRDYITGLFELSKNLDPKYSYKKFAVDLGFPESNLVWLIATGRRKLTTKTSSRIATALKLPKSDEKYLKTLMEYNNSTKADERENLFEQLIVLKGKEIADAGQKAIFEYYSEWHHPVIREMAALKNFRYDPEWIAKQLKVNLRPLQIKKSLELLERLDFIKYDSNSKKISRSEEQIFPEQASENIAMARYHQKMCEVARDSITKVESAKRDFNALTISVSASGAAEVQKLIQELCSKVMEIDRNEKNREDVFQVNVQLFPLTNTDSNQSDDENDTEEDNNNVETDTEIEKNEKGN